MHLKKDGWKTIVSFGGPAYLQGRIVDFGILLYTQMLHAWYIYLHLPLTKQQQI